MQPLIPNRKRSLLIVALLLALSLLLTTGVGAQDGGAPGGAVSALPSVPYGGGPVPGGPGFVSISSMSFRPYVPTSSYGFSSSGLKNTGAYSAWFYAPFQIPNKAVINQMVVYYLDNDPGGSMNLDADLVLVPLLADGGYLMAEVVSSGSNTSPVYGATSSILFPTVDLSVGSYMVQVNLPASSNVILLGVRIDYGYSVSLPVIKR